MKTIKKNLIVAVIAVVLIVCTFWVTGKNYQTSLVVEVPLQETYSITGHVHALHELIIHAPLTGKITAMYVDEGTQVYKGQVLVSYEQDQYQYQLNELQAGKGSASAYHQKLKSGNRLEEINRMEALYQNSMSLLKQKELDYQNVLKESERNSKLFKDKVITAKEYEDTVNLLEQKQALYHSQKQAVKSSYEDFMLAKKGNRPEDIRAAREEIKKIAAQIGSLETVMRKTNVRSDLDGMIVKRYIDPHQFVQEGDRLFLVADKKAVEIEGAVEEEDLEKLKKSGVIQLELDAYPGKILEGKLIKVIENVEQETRLIPVKIAVVGSHKDITIIPGMTVTCTFYGKKDKQLAIPPEALFQDKNKYYVKTKEGVRYIQVLGYNEDQALIGGDIKAGDAVILK